MRRLRWWLFLLRYRVARWRGKTWATGMLRPEFIFAYKERERVGAFMRMPDGRGDYGYFDADHPTCRVWKDPHA